MSIIDKQSTFLLNVAKLIIWAFQNGYQLTGGELWRTPEQARLNAASGKGISTSLHLDRLAIDLMLFVDGVYQTQSEAYAPLGLYWKLLAPSNRWGGDFTRPDGNHFSMSPDGKRA